MRKTASEILGFLRSLIIPDLCLSCGKACFQKGELCRECYDTFIRESKEVCPVCRCTATVCECGIDFSRHTTELGNRKFAALTFYKSRTDYPDSDRLTEKMIYTLKTTGTYSEFFSWHLADEVRRIFSDSPENLHEWRVTYIPRTQNKKLTSGVDQSEELAAGLARKLNIPKDHLFGRYKGTEQKYLGKEDRMANMEESLYLTREPEKGGKYLIVDDIITSGASMETAARLLRYQGAEQVFPVTVCRNMKKEKQTVKEFE